MQSKRTHHTLSSQLPIRPLLFLFCPCHDKSALQIEEAYIDFTVRNGHFLCVGIHSFSTRMYGFRFSFGAFHEGPVPRGGFHFLVPTCEEKWLYLDEFQTNAAHLMDTSDLQAIDERRCDERLAQHICSSSLKESLVVIFGRASDRSTSLLQSSIVVAGLWGMYYREVQGCVPIALFFLSSAGFLAGIFLELLTEPDHGRRR